jgi:hypothetical protein
MTVTGFRAARDAYNALAAAPGALLDQLGGHPQIRAGVKVRDVPGAVRRARHSNLVDELVVARAGLARVGGGRSIHMGLTKP